MRLNVKEASEPDRLKPPSYWLIRAEQVRTIRDGMKSELGRAMLERIAKDYERLAWQAMTRAGNYDELMMETARHYGEYCDEV